MKTVNKVIMIGHLASDVELKQTKNGNSVANFPLATDRKKKSESGELINSTDFHRVIAWGKLGETCMQYLTKGSAVYLEGSILNRSFDDKEGKKHYRSEVVANDINFLSYKKRDIVDEK